MYDFQKKLKSVLLMSTEKKLILAGGLWTGGAAKRDVRGIAGVDTALRVRISKLRAQAPLLARGTPKASTWNPQTACVGSEICEA